MADDQPTFFIKESSWRELVRILRVSPRESEIIRCMMTGETDAAIASRLGISTHTVRTHLERLYNKLNVNSRSQMIARIFSEYVSLVQRGLAPLLLLAQGIAQIHEVLPIV